MPLSPRCFSFFFFNDTATTEIYTLSLHDALPICSRSRSRRLQPFRCFMTQQRSRRSGAMPGRPVRTEAGLRVARHRSEEHTSELQSQSNLVCRLLLEKKKKTKTNEITSHEKLVTR